MRAVSIKSLQQGILGSCRYHIAPKWAHICIEMQNLWKNLILERPWISFRLKLTRLKKNLLPAGNGTG